MRRSILVYDIGTTSVKSAIFDETGALRASVSSAYNTAYPRPGWAEQDPDEFWRAAVRGTAELLNLPEAEGVSIEVIGLSGHMNGCLPVDAGGRPVHPELIHSDSRSAAQCARIKKLFAGDYLYRAAGNRLDEHLSLPKMLWLKDEREEAFNRTAFFLNAKDYLRGKLTGDMGITDFSDASLTGVFDLAKRGWAWDIIDGLGLGRQRFPRPIESTGMAGKLSREAASLLSLPAGIPVSAGGGDGSCATRGALLRGGGEAYISLGSSAWASVLADKPVFDPKRRIQNFFDLDGFSCNICGTVQCAGIALDWAFDLLWGKDTRQDYRAVEDELEELPPGSGGILFLPYLMGERTPHWDAAARGLFIGLSLSSGRNAVLRSVYEGVAFALKDIIAVYDDLGLPVDSLTLLGGGVRSAFWQKMIRDIIGKPMKAHPFPSHAISLGAALAAGVSVGIWRDLSGAVKQVNAVLEKDKEDIENDEKRSRQYERYFGMYRKLYSRVKPLFDELADSADQNSECGVQPVVRG
jgi:xylulokinase